MLSQNECSKIIGKKITRETYIIVKRMFLGSSYQDIKEQLEEERKKLQIKGEFTIISEDIANDQVKMIKEKINIPWEEKSGVYCIKINNEIIYIGKTSVSFKIRFQQHKSKMQNDDLFLYQLLRQAKLEGKKRSMEPMLITEDIEEKNKIKIDEQGLDNMELALISLLQPIGNIEGRIKPYRYQKEQIKK